MALSGLLVLVVQYIGKFSLPEGSSALILSFYFLFFFAIMRVLAHTCYEEEYGYSFSSYPKC